MKRKYICPNVFVARLNTTNNILTLSGGDSGSLDLSEETTNSVWTKEDKGWDIWGDDYNE